MVGCFSFGWTRWDVQLTESWEMAHAELVAAEEEAAAAAAAFAAAAAAAAETAALSRLHLQQVRVWEGLVC